MDGLGFESDALRFKSNGLKVLVQVKWAKVWVGWLRFKFDELGFTATI